MPLGNLPREFLCNPMKAMPLDNTVPRLEIGGTILLQRTILHGSVVGVFNLLFRPRIDRFP